MVEPHGSINREHMSTKPGAAEVADVTDVTIRNRYKGLTDRLGILIEL